jgi:hypothetical protein
MTDQQTQHPSHASSFINTHRKQDDDNRKFRTLVVLIILTCQQSPSNLKAINTLKFFNMKLIIAASLVASAAAFGSSVAPKFTPDKNAFA